MKDCYRTYGDLETKVRDLIDECYEQMECDEIHRDDTFHISFYVAKYLVDNGYEISKYEIDGPDGDGNEVD